MLKKYTIKVNIIPMIAPVLYLTTNSRSWSSAFDFRAIRMIKMILVRNIIQKWRNPATSQTAKISNNTNAIRRKYHIAISFLLNYLNLAVRNSDSYYINYNHNSYI